MCYGCTGIMTRLYISQKRIDAWISDNRLHIEGDIMTLVELGRSFTIVPAVRVLAVEGASAGKETPDDPHDLIGKVKDETELAAMGADHLASSLILDDTAYKVENGFVGEPEPKGSKSG